MPDEVTSLKNFLSLIETRLDLTEPAELDDGCSVVGLAPAKHGLVGLDVDTGRPVQVGWKYKTIHEKPVIINAGDKQTVIPPKPAPPPMQPPHVIDIIMAGALFEDMRARFQPGDYWTEADVGAKNCFVNGCLANPDFYVKWRTKLDTMVMPERPPADARPQPLPTGGRPAQPRLRQRVVDT